MSRVVCLMNVEADRASFTWSEGPASFEPYKLEGMSYQEFKEIAETVRERLADLVKDYLFDQQNMHKSAFALAEAGHELYEVIFQPDAEQARAAKQVRKWLEKLAGEQQVHTLEVVVESPWSLPWNVIYDEEPDKAAFLSGDDSPERWKPFWGLRYNLAGGRKVDPLRRIPLLKDPKVLMVVDPEIRDGLPDAQRQRLADFADAHSLKVVHSKDELQDALKAQRPDLLYWLSHAEPDALVLGGEPISPRNIRKLLRQDDEDQFGGLAFLNACQTAEGGTEGSFFEAFHNVGFAGMIGTEHQTIDQFANPLGLDFLEAFLDRGQPVGATLRKLRGRVPLGLLYGTYCPPDIRVDLGTDDDSLNIQQVHAAGAMLGSGSGATATPRRKRTPLPDEPYRSLAYYDRQDRALFAGRDDDIERFATYLDDPSTRLLVLHGESGVGKSSFLRAGVIPYLEEECLGYRFIRDREPTAGEQMPGSVLFVRATNDLFGQLAQALCDFCTRPYEYQTPLGEQVSADLPGVLGGEIGDVVNQASVRAMLRGDAALLGRVMAAISERLPFAPILVVDQGEEVFTLAQTPEDIQRGNQALDMLRRTVATAGNFKVIFSLRTEYYGRVIDRLRRGLHDTGKIREYLLTDFDETALLEAIRRPTATTRIPYASEVPFKKFGFSYAEGVAEEIAHRVVRYTAQRRDSVLPLMQVICGQLYRMACRRANHTITLSDLDRLGGIEGGMRNHVEGLLAELLRGRPLDKQPLQKLFTQLYLKQPDGALTTALLAEDEVEKRWAGRMPFGELLQSSQAMRLLKVNSLRIGMNEERRYVSLGHDALAKIAADWDEELSRGVRMRKMVAAISVVSAVAVVMLALTIWAFVERGKAVTAKDEALDNFQKARQSVDTFFVTVSEDTLLNAPGMQGLRKTLLSRAQQYYNDYLKEAGDSQSDELQKDIARTNYYLGVVAEATDGEQAALSEYKKAKDIQENLASRITNDDTLLYDLGNTWNAMGRAYDNSGQQNEAKDAYNQALGIRQRLAEKYPLASDLVGESLLKAAEYQRKLASTKMNIGLVKRAIGLDHKDFSICEDAITEIQDAQRIRLRIENLKAAAANPPEKSQLDATLFKNQRDLAMGYWNLAKLEQDISDNRLEKDGVRYLGYNDAVDHYKEALTWLTSCNYRVPNDWELKFVLGECYRGLGSVYKSSPNPIPYQVYEGRYQKQLESLSLAKAEFKQLVDFNPDVIKYHAALARAELLAGNVYVNWRKRQLKQADALDSDNKDKAAEHKKEAAEKMDLARKSFESAQGILEQHKEKDTSLQLDWDQAQQLLASLDSVKSE